MPFQLDADGVPGIKLRTDNDGACLLPRRRQRLRCHEDRRRFAATTRCIAEHARKGHLRGQAAILPGPGGSRRPRRGARDHGPRLPQGAGVAEYDEFNRSWYELILKKKSGGPGVGKPNEMSLQLFFMASFNFDMLRRFVLSDNFQAVLQPAPGDVRRGGRRRYRADQVGQPA